MPEISEELIKDEFVRWWTESYNRPPGTHAIMTHVPFAMHIIQKLKQQEEAEAQPHCDASSGVQLIEGVGKILDSQPWNIPAVIYRVAEWLEEYEWDDAARALRREVGCALSREGRRV